MDSVSPLPSPHGQMDSGSKASSVADCNGIESLPLYVLIGETLGFELVAYCLPALTAALLFLWVVHRIHVYRDSRRLRKRLQSAVRAARDREQALQVAASLRPVGRAGPGLADDDDATVQLRCAVCLVAPIRAPVELLPCGHREFCARCVVEMWRLGSSGVLEHLHCPLCRGEVACIIPDYDARARIDHSEEKYPSAPGTPPLTPTRWCEVSSLLGVPLDGLDDDILLQGVYSVAVSLDSKEREKASWWWVRCILFLRALTNAQWLPLVVGLRIALLHLTMVAYLILPGDVGVSLDIPRNSKPAITSATGQCVAHSAIIRGIGTGLDWSAQYADDVFFFCMCTIPIGHLMQCLLFTDVTDAAVDGQ